MAKDETTTKDNKCIFCEISAGNIQTAGKFWEDEEFMAWLALYPNTKGFSCVIPKQHFGSDVLKMPDDVLQRFIIASKKVANILENYFDDVGRVGLMVEGTGIDHAHIKLVPLHGTENLKKTKHNNNKNQQKKKKKKKKKSVGEDFFKKKKFFFFKKSEGWISSG